MATKQTTLDDLVRQVSRLIGTTNSVLERYARLGEEYDSNRLANEELRELIKELIEESSRHADKLSERMDRIERYTILSKFGNVSVTLEIESSVAKEHIERALSERLIEQQELAKQYQNNITIVQKRMARLGETVASLNELEEYQSKLNRALEAMKRIREQLK